MIYNGDCLEIIKELGENTVDHTFTSPPYNIGLNKELDSKAKSKYDQFKDKRPDYFDWCTQIIDELLRITDHYVFWNIQANARNKKQVFKLIGHYADLLEQNFIWYKKNATPSSAQYYVTNSVEYILCFSKKKVKANTHFITNFVDIPKGTKSYGDFNAVMPEQLAHYFIENFTSENQLILDPFLGVGTTGVVCKKLNRAFIGIELVEDYYNIAKERIETV
tara:strand:+ start:1271 stop:1933 length:663 start_codon:yes stop_codon:yes gene_type:complete